MEMESNVLVKVCMIVHGYRVNETEASVHGSQLVDIWIMGVVSEGMMGCNCMVFDIVIMYGSTVLSITVVGVCDSGNQVGNDFGITNG